MLTDTWMQVIYFFLIYSFLGWVVEVIYHAVAQGVIVNRGFLNGPVCPIYGFGMLLILYLLLPISDQLPVLFIGGMVLTTSIEFFGGWMLEKLFHMRWWDYSKEPFNLHGYICARFSIAWGLGVVGIVRVIHPVTEGFKHWILDTNLRWLPVLLLVVLVIDMLATVMSVLHLQKELRLLETMAKNMREISDNMTQVIGGRALEADQKLGEGRVQVALGKAELKQQTEEKRKALEAELTEYKRQMQGVLKRIHRHKLFGAGRIIHAYPQAFLHRRGMRLTEYIEKIKGPSHQ